MFFSLTHCRPRSADTRRIWTPSSPCIPLVHVACHPSGHRCLTSKRRPRAEPHNTIWAESDRFATARCWPVPGSTLWHAARPMFVAFLFFELTTSDHMCGMRLCSMPKVGSQWTSSLTSMLSQVRALVEPPCTSYRNSARPPLVNYRFRTLFQVSGCSQCLFFSAASVCFLFISSQRLVPVHDARTCPFTSCASTSGTSAVLGCLFATLLPSSPPTPLSFLYSSVQGNHNLVVTR